MTSTAAPRFDQAIRLRHATSIVVGTIVGASIFVQPSEVTTYVHSVGGVLLVWALAGALTLVGSLVCAELASIFIESGGVYVYLREAFHPLAGFLWGWAMLLTMHSGIIAAIATVVARYVGAFIPMGTAATRGVAVGVIVVLSAVNYVGVRTGSRVQTAFTAVKLAAVALIVTLGAVLGGRVPAHFVGGSGAGTTAGGALAAMSAALFAYGGWHLVTYSAAETEDAARTIPRALIRGTLLVTGAYLAMNAVYLYVLPLDQVAGSSRVAADLMDALLGSGGAIMSALVIFSGVGSLTGIILGGPRVYFAMARDGLLFRWFGELHPRFATPHRAIVLQGVWASALAATGTFRALFTRVVYTEWIFFALVALGLIILRRRAGIARRYTMPWYPVLPAVFIAASLAVVVRAIVANPLDSALGLSIVLAGIPVYYIWRPSRGRAREPHP